MVEDHPNAVKTPSVWISLLPVAMLIGALYISLVVYRDLELTTHTALVFGTVIAAVIAIRLGFKWNDLEEGMVEGISLSTKACLILLMIGMLVGSWIQSGIVPAMIYYGLKLLTPSIFLIATCVICALVSLATGSSWSTAATIGIALIGVGEGLGFARSKVAGAIISGAYFGDKMSPLSDTTNLAPAVAGAKLFDHVRHMIYTTGPSLIIALILYGIMGFGGHQQASTQQVDSLLAVLSKEYVIHPLLLVPVLLVIMMVVLRLPALPAVIGGWAIGAILAEAVQKCSFGQILQTAYSGVTLTSGDKLVDSLLSRGGMTSMFSTVILIICAMCFGGIMERSKMLGAIASGMLSLAHGDGGLVLATVLSCLAMNILASDQYLSVVVPGRMFREAYRMRNLEPKNLSRALEDSGTLTSPLIPWNTCGAYMTASLGIKPWTYVPYCFLNLINPFVSIFYGYTGITLTKMAPKNKIIEG